MQRAGGRCTPSACYTVCTGVAERMHATLGVGLLRPGVLWGHAGATSPFIRGGSVCRRRTSRLCCCTILPSFLYAGPATKAVVGPPACNNDTHCCCTLAWEPPCVCPPGRTATASISGWRADGEGGAALRRGSPPSVPIHWRG